MWRSFATQISYQHNIHTTKLYLVVLFIAWTLSCLVGTADAAAYAQHIHAAVTKNTDTIIQLSCTDATFTTVTITSIPTAGTGTLYMLSSNYITFGYLPARGTAITASGTVVVDSSNSLKIVFNAPLSFTGARFTYTTTDGSTTSSTGIVDITTTDNRLVYSDFHFTAESWTVVRPSYPTPQSAVASWTGTSTGSLNHYIYSGDPDLVVDQINIARWYFQSPAATSYAQNNANLYGGTLNFVMGAFAGQFTVAKRLALPFTLVSLECSSCGTTGVSLAIRNTDFTGSITSYSFTLTESGGWKIDPKDTRITVWSAPTQCQFLTVLAHLSSIRIYGQISTDYEALGIDAVSLKISTSTTVPTACYAVTTYGQTVY